MVILFFDGFLYIIKDIFSLPYSVLLFYMIHILTVETSSKIEVRMMSRFICLLNNTQNIYARAELGLNCNLENTPLIS